MAILLAVGAILLFYFLGYRGYSRVLSEKIFDLSNAEVTPAHQPELRDDYDYLPTRKHILWGHHYTSIAGAAPIIGPAVAVIWGWAPALFWVVFGTIFIGAVHDFGALVVSARNGGKTVGELSGEVIHPRVRILFQLIIYFLIWIVLPVFAFAIGVLFHKYPASVIPVNFEIFVAVIMGYLFYKKNVKILIPSIISLVLLYAMIGVGVSYPISIVPYIGVGDPVTVWAIALLIYAAIASILPVWVLLQPRDYINSHQLIVGLIALVLGLIVLNPDMVAPALNLHPKGAPPLFPILFITIACGAISGFHGLVGSGTTSKQLDKMEDARSIGYGGMLGEGVLALMATLAVAAGLKDWGLKYLQWNGSGINAIANFVEGAGHFLEALFIPVDWANAVVAVLAISFAATSMDTGARIQRLVVSELGGAIGLPFLKNKYVATLLAIGPTIPLVIAGPKVWQPLWMLFGTTNQLVGGMTLLVVFVYLARAKKPLLQYAIPMLFVIIVTTCAMCVNLWTWAGDIMTGKSPSLWITLTIGSMIFALEIWMVLEAFLIIRKIKTSSV